MWCLAGHLMTKDKKQKPSAPVTNSTEGKGKKKNLRAGKSKLDNEYADSDMMLLQCIREAQESEERKKMIAQMKEEEKEMHEQALEQIKTNIRQKRLERSQARKERLKAASSMTVAEKKKALQMEKKKFREQKQHCDI